MGSSPFHHLPAGLTAEQHAGWTVRQRLAENALVIFCADGSEPDSIVVGHLQSYVADHISRPQAIARIVDHHACTDRRPPPSGCPAAGLGTLEGRC